MSHAGSGTLLAAITRGLPQVVIPQGADQFLNAAARGASGACIVIEPGNVTVGRVRETARGLLDDPAFRAAAERVSERLRRCRRRRRSWTSPRPVRRR